MLKQLICAAVVAAFLCGCNGAEEDPKTGDDAFKANPVRARKILYEGEEAAKKGDYKKARALFKEAERFANLNVREEIRRSREHIDNKQAKAFAEDIINAAERGDCAVAIDDTLPIIAQGEGLGRFIRMHTDKAIVGCVEGMLDDEEKDQLAAARKLMASDNAKKALIAASHAGLSKKLRKAVSAALKEVASEPLAERKWAAALEAVDALIKIGKAGKSERDKVTKLVRKGIVDDIAEAHEEAMADTKVGKQKLAQIEALIDIGWPKDEQGKRAAAPPKDMVRKRLELAFVIACDSVSCKTDNVGKRWTYGDVKPSPPLDPRGKAEGKLIKSGKPVWEIATGGAWSLVTLKDPGRLNGAGARAGVGVGWVKSSALKTEDTSEWLPPGKSLIGTRVWAPLRKGQKLLELGRVIKLQGAKVTVRRLADRKEIDVSRRQLRFGATKKGTKVMGYCRKLTKLEPALIENVKEVMYEVQGDPLVTLACLDDQGKPTGVKKEGQLGSVRIDPSWLPKQR